jgi:fumarate hydratase class II
MYVHAYALDGTGGDLGSKTPVHPNDHVNRGQSSNDTFPTVMHVATVEELSHSLVPSVTALRDSLAAKATEFDHVIKCGRTHMMDATPLTVGQEFSGWVAQLDGALKAIDDSLAGVREIALGGSAVGTGLNTPAGFDKKVAAAIAAKTGLAFVTAPNKFAALGSVDAMVGVSGALKRSGHIFLLLFSISHPTSING